MSGPQSDDFFDIFSKILLTVHGDRSAMAVASTTLATGLLPSAVPGDRKRAKIPFSCPAGEAVRKGRYKEELVLFDAPVDSGITVDGIGTAKINWWIAAESALRLHNHPFKGKHPVYGDWSFFSKVLGGYLVEKVVREINGVWVEEIRTHSAGDILVSRPDEYHTIIEVGEKTTTFMLCAPRISTWGCLIQENGTYVRVNHDDPRLVDPSWRERYKQLNS